MGYSVYMYNMYMMTTNGIEFTVLKTTECGNYCITRCVSKESVAIPGREKSNCMR